MDAQRIYWPFPVKPEVDWTEFDRDLIAFMRTAFDDGFRPYLYGNDTCVEAGEWPSGRSATLIWRGRINGYEPRLGDSGQAVPLGPAYGLNSHACVCVRPPFRHVAHLALEWLRGRPLDSLLQDFEYVGGYPQGIVMRTRPRSAAAIR